MQFYDTLLGHDPEPWFNSRGHRCHEIEETNLRNYLLFVGDNLGVGEGKSIDEIYPHLIAKKLNMDYYNLCILNGGLDAIKYNLLTWSNKIPQSPKAIIVVTEFLNRFMVCDKNYDNLHTIDPNLETAKRISSSGDKTGFWNARQLFMNKLMEHYTNVPIYQLVSDNMTSAFKTSNTVNIKHTGKINDHEKIATLITAEFQSRMMKARP
jgi:hypothetical protein